MHSTLPQDGDVVNAWGHKFSWTPLHQTPDQYRNLKFTFDTLGSDCINLLTPLSESKSALPKHGTDLYFVLRDCHASHEKLQQLWDEVNLVPSWVDWDQVARGQDVFYRYGTATITGLAFQSLLGGTGGSGPVAETLSKTGGFSLKNARKRLLETTQFVLQCTDSLESIKPGGAGFATALRVRLLHATVRRRILQLASERAQYFPVEEHGVPINDADCIGTISSFSSTLIWQSLPRQGIFLRQQEIVDYLALWRLIAHYMGTPTEPFSSPAKAKAILETTLLYEYTPSPTSRLLVRNIIRAIENQPPTYASRNLIVANTRWLNGDELCDALDMARPPLYYSILAAAQCLLLAVVCYTSRIIPALDRVQINAFKRPLWSIVIEPRHSGLGSLSIFDFKYLPGHEKITVDSGDIAEKQAKVFWTADRKALAVVLLPSVCTLLVAWAVLQSSRSIFIGSNIV